MDERLRQLLDQALDHHPEYELTEEDMLIITRISLRAFLDYLHRTHQGVYKIRQAIDAVILSIPIDD